MKKILLIAMALMLALSVSAFAAEDDEMCPSCAKEKCDVPRLCAGDQAKCTSAMPCNVLINICNCGDGSFWQNNDYVGVRIESITPGVYFLEGDVFARLFRYKNTTTVTLDDDDFEEFYWGPDGDTAMPRGSFIAPNSNSAAGYDVYYNRYLMNSGNGTLNKFRVVGACEFLQGDLCWPDMVYTGSAGPPPASGNFYNPTYMAYYDTGAPVFNPAGPFAGPVASGMMCDDYSYWWSRLTSLDYFDADGDKINTVKDFNGECELSSDQKVDMVQSKKSSPWVLDVTNTPVASFTADKVANNDWDGWFSSEDQGDYLAIKMPGVIVDWAEVEAADLKGTTAQANVCILDMKNAESGLCTDCAIICCCTVDTVRLCPPSRDRCIYFPYTIYGQQEAGWGTGIVLSNLTFDNNPLIGEAKTVSIAAMSVDFTITDQTGTVHEGTFDSFTKAVEAFNVDDLVDNKLGLEGVAPGNLYIKVEANFDIDGYEFNLLNSGSISFGAGVLPRACVWNSADIFMDAYGSYLYDGLVYPLTQGKAIPFMGDF